MKNLDKYLDGKLTDFQVAADEDSFQDLRMDQEFSLLTKKISQNPGAFNEILYPSAALPKAEVALLNIALKSFTALYFSYVDVKKEWVDTKIEAKEIQSKFPYITEIMTVLSEKFMGIDRAIDLYQKSILSESMDCYPSKINRDTVSEWESQNENYDLILEIADAMNDSNPGLFKKVETSHSEVFTALVQMPDIWMQRQNGQNTRSQDLSSNLFTQWDDSASKLIGSMYEYHEKSRSMLESYLQRQPDKTDKNDKSYKSCMNSSNYLEF